MPIKIGLPNYFRSFDTKSFTFIKQIACSKQPWERNLQKDLLSLFLFYLRNINLKIVFNIFCSLLFCYLILHVLISIIYIDTYIHISKGPRITFFIFLLFTILWLKQTKAFSNLCERIKYLLTSKMVNKPIKCWL